MDGIERQAEVKRFLEGLGYTVFTALAASHNPSGTLMFRPLTRPAVTRRICLITRKGRQLSPAAAAMRDELVATVRSVALPEGVRRLVR